MGVMATFNTTTNRNALPLSPGQKFKLFFRSSTDPWPFLLASVVAGIGQARNSNPEWGQGAQGYAKRFGASYSDAFIGNFFGNAVLPVVLHEDPRFFQKGSGGVAKRILWAASSAFWCRRDNGTWGPNYANVGGNMIGAAISRVYYPASQRNATDVITDGLTVSVEGIAGAEVIEFWPDLVRHHKNKAKKEAGRRSRRCREERRSISVGFLYNLHRSKIEKEKTSHNDLQSPIGAGKSPSPRSPQSATPSGRTQPMMFRPIILRLR